MFPNHGINCLSKSFWLSLLHLILHLAYSDCIYIFPVVLGLVLTYAGVSQNKSFFHGFWLFVHM